MRDKWKKFCSEEVRFLRVLSESPPLHFYLLQFVGFAYLFYRFASRNYAVYGLLPDDAFQYPRCPPVELLPVPVLHFTTFQFIYTFIPRPSPEVITGMQGLVMAACALGMIGILPKVCAWIAFLLAAHMTGMMQSSNAELDGGCIALATALILALSPSESFYGPRRGFSLSRRGVGYHWPVFLLFLVVGAYYSLSGLNKLVDVGPHWPFVLHLENLATTSTEDSLFLSSRYANPGFSQLASNYGLSVVMGGITLTGELFFITVLWLPRYRWFFVLSMVVLHVMVFAMAGINFVGSSVLLLLCMDWNVFVRRVTVCYDGGCGFCDRWVARLKRLDWFGRVDWTPIADGVAPKMEPARLTEEMGLRDENGEICYGADALEQLAHRLPALYPLALALKLPGMISAARVSYRRIARRRHSLGGCPVQ